MEAITLLQFSFVESFIGSSRSKNELWQGRRLGRAKRCEDISSCKCPSHTLASRCGWSNWSAPQSQFRFRLANASFRPDAIMPCFQIAVLPPDDIVSNALYAWGSWECSHGPQCFESRGASPFPKSGVFLDIGANIGYFSTLFAKAGYRVLAIEPVSRNVHALRNTLCLNPDIEANVTIVHTALGSKSTFGPCVAEAHRTNSGNAVLRCGPNVSCSDLEAPRYHFEDTVRAKERRTRVSRSRGYCEDVNISTLDYILRNFLPAAQGQSVLPVVAAKIDAEGAECDIFEGGGTLFTVIRPIMIYFESQHAHVLACMKQLADQHDYTLKPGLKWSTPKRMPLNVVLVRDDWRI